MAVTNHKNALYAAAQFARGQMGKNEAVRILAKDHIDGAWNKNKAERKFMSGSANIDPMRSYAQAEVYGGWDAFQHLIDLRHGKAHNENEVGSFTLYEYWTFAPFFAAYHSPSAPAKTKEAAMSWMRAFWAHVLLSAVPLNDPKLKWHYNGQEIGPADLGFPANQPIVLSAGARNIFSKPQPKDSWLTEQLTGSLLAWCLNLPGRRTPGRVRREEAKLYDEHGQTFAHQIVRIFTGVPYSQTTRATSWGISEDERQAMTNFLMSWGQENKEIIGILAGDWKQLTEIETVRRPGQVLQVLSKDTAGTKPAIMIFEADGNSNTITLHSPVEYKSNRHERATATLVQDDVDQTVFGICSGQKAGSKSARIGRSGADLYHWGPQGLAGAVGEPGDDPGDDPGDPGDDTKAQLVELWERLQGIEEKLGKYTEQIEKILDLLGGLQGKKGKNIEKILTILGELRGGGDED